MPGTMENTFYTSIWEAKAGEMPQVWGQPIYSTYSVLASVEKEGKEVAQ